MKALTKALSEAAIRERYPIEGKIPGWFFRQQEVSNGSWLVEGTDRWGRLVSHRGSDPDELLRLCKRDAAHLQRTLNEKEA